MKTVYQYDGARDVVLWAIDEGGINSISEGIEAAAAEAAAALPAATFAQCNDLTYGLDKPTGKIAPDGLPLLLAVIDTGQMPSDTLKLVPHGITNLKMVWSCQGIMYRPPLGVTELWSEINSIWSAGFSNAVQVLGDDIRINAVSDHSLYTQSTTFIYYTKELQP